LPVLWYLGQVLLKKNTSNSFHGLTPFSKFDSYTANKMVFHIVSKKQQENIILFVVVMG